MKRTDFSGNRMYLSDFTFIVTDQCNFRCHYCRQKKESKYITLDLAKKTIDFFYPYWAPSISIYFFGGEPLLAYSTIVDTLNYLDKKNTKGKQIKFSISTNGSLLKKEILNVFNDNHFLLLLSFDGYAQDIGRREGSFNDIMDTISSIKKYPRIDLEINSVFTPATIGYLAKSVQLACDLELKKMTINLSMVDKWEKEDLIKYEKELSKTVDILVSSYKNKESIPISNFNFPSSDPPAKGIFSCSAGKNRMAVSPTGDLWGCYLFHDYFKGKENTKDFSRYSFKNLNEFSTHHQVIYPEILSNYSHLSMDNLGTCDTFCFLCSDIVSCSVCPITAAYASNEVGKIPGWFCEINRIKKKCQYEFHEKIKQIQNQ